MPAAGFDQAKTVALEPWRAVEAQHVVSTTMLVDALAEQELLERLLEESKPRLSEALVRLHWLLFTPFRYPPPPGGSRFRGEADPGVFYAADSIETACAELGYWRWRHLLDSPDLDHIPSRGQSVFRVAVRARGIDLRERPLNRRRKRWTDPISYDACQDLARKARAADIALIRYESVRDPKHGGCVAVLDPTAFSRQQPIATQSWILSVFRDRVVWRKDDPLHSMAIEIDATEWR